MTSDDMFKKIMDLGITKVSLEKKEFEQVLEILIYDGKEEKKDSAALKEKWSINIAVLIRRGVCPVIYSMLLHSRR